MPELNTKITISAKATQALAELGRVADEFKRLGSGAQQGGADAESGLKRARREVAGLGTDARRAADETDAAFNRAARGGIGSLSSGLSRLRTELISFFAAKLSLEGLAGLGAIADRMSLIDARLKLATKSQAEFAVAQRATLDIARRTGQPLQETVQLYARLADSVRELGGNQQDALKLTETINQAIVVSGASAGASAAGIQQLAQAFASGVLRGDEFNSVMENTPRVAKAIADGLGVPIGALRQMAEEGKLTADVVAKALAGQAGVVAREFGQMPLTIGRAFQSLRTEFEQLVARADKSTGASQTLARAIKSLAENIDTLATAVKLLGEALLFAFAGAALGQAVTGLRALAAGVTAVNGALALFVGGAVLSQLAKLGAGARGGLIGLALFGTYTLAKYVAEISGVTEAVSRLIDRFRGANNYDPRTLAELKAEVARMEALPPEGRDQAKLQALRAQIARETPFADQFQGGATAGAAPAARPRPLTEDEKKRLENLKELIDKSRELAATQGLTARQVAIYQAAQLGATAADIKAIEAAFDIVEWKDRETEAQKRAENASKQAAQTEKQRLESIVQLVTNYRDQAETLGFSARQLAQYQAAQLGATAADRAAIDAAFNRIEAADRETALRKEQLADAEERKQAIDDEAEAWARVDQARQQDAESIRQTIDPFRTLNQELARAKELLKFNVLSTAEFDAIAANIRSRIEQVQADLDHAKGGFSAFAEEAARNIQSTFADFLFDPFSNGIQGMLSGFVSALHRMASEALAAGLLQKLLGDFGAGKSGGGSSKIGGLIGGALDFLSGLFHSGGIIGLPGMTRRVPALAFAGAPRLHSGGVVGLGPDEVPIIGQRGEEVLTTNDPRHRNNAGASAGRGVRIVNVIDPAMARDFMDSPSGEQVVLNILQRNAGAVRQIMA